MVRVIASVSNRGHMTGRVILKNIPESLVEISLNKLYESRRRRWLVSYLCPDVQAYLL